MIDIINLHIQLRNTIIIYIYMIIDTYITNVVINV
jgi:hypothetical protein